MSTARPAPLPRKQEHQISIQAEPQAAESDENRLFPKQADSHGISHTY